MSAASNHNVVTEDVVRTCQILILCEDFTAYERAAECCWRILVQLADDLDFSFNCWNFYELSDPECTQSVIRSAKTSDVILLSLHQPQLPAIAENWLNTIAGHRTQADGVLALVLNEPADSPEAVVRLVERLEMHARKLGMDFLSLAQSPSTDVVAGFTSATGTSGGYGEWNNDHWGLNE
jgi:hypothetical protein